jgi:plasmid maintenance system antidote protein VapI
MVTAELALRLGRALEQTPHYWLNLQTTYDLKVVQTDMKDSLLGVRAATAACGHCSDRAKSCSSSLLPTYLV